MLTTNDPTAVMAAVRDEIEAALADFLATRNPPAELRDTAPLHAALRDFGHSPGKRLRGLLCYWGWRGADGQDPSGVFRAAAALELFHTAAIFHDDLIDGSDTRRGEPSLHQRLARHAPEDRQSGGLPFGAAAAVLAGDLCLVWAGELLQTATADPARRAAATRIYHEMAAEVVLGQYQDVVEEIRGPSTLERAMAVTHYKAARYTFERPLQIGGALAGAPESLHTAYSRFAVPAGEAFQLRDDMLGVFGDPAVTGKSNLDDLRDGKATPLMALALEAATDTQRERIERLHGDRLLTEDDADELRTVLVETGAPERVEDLVSQRVAAAGDALDRAGLNAEATAALRALLGAAVNRAR
ncbi:polyprenyl synthetase family protein [Nocardiopsis rhodophaea]|uniref:polyprenyl synthetase family protein n=1 Tax=Nocardiopsis rhodophaea TaxID=280238 RepID=UPI0031D38738